MDNRRRTSENKENLVESRPRRLIAKHFMESQVQNFPKKSGQIFLQKHKSKKENILQKKKQ